MQKTRSLNTYPDVKSPHYFLQPRYFSSLELKVNPGSPVRLRMLNRAGSMSLRTCQARTRSLSKIYLKLLISILERVSTAYDETAYLEAPRLTKQGIPQWLSTEP